MLKLGYDLLQEAALYVLNTSSIEAALSIFTEVNNLLDYCIYICRLQFACSSYLFLVLLSRDCRVWSRWWVWQDEMETPLMGWK